MNYETARERLLNHSNLTHGLSHVSDDESLLFVLWNANKSKIAPSGLAEISKDIVTCLEIVNTHWNGAVPSKTLNSPKEIERILVSAISQIVHESWQYFREWQETQLFEPQLLQQLSLTAWTVSCAWNAVLDGDIDEIAKNVEAEEMAWKFLETKFVR